MIVFQQIATDFLYHIVYFPVWWYSAGLWKVIRGAVDFFRFGNGYLAPGLWLRNLFVPMFGQYDWQGRIMSFFMRLVNVFFRTIFLAVWVIVILCVVSLWVVCPIAITYMLIQSIPRL